MSHMLIIGGSDAGVSAALRIKELDERAEVTIVLADAYPGYSVCGLPFFLSGEVPDWRALAHHGAAEFEERGIRLLTEHRVETIFPGLKKVQAITPDRRSIDISYDKLLIATGAEPARPPFDGLDLPGVFHLRWMGDGLAINSFLEQSGAGSCVIIGGGYIGLEVAEALTRRGLEVTVLEFAPEVLLTMDPAMGRLVRTELEANGVRVFTDRAVAGIERERGKLLVRCAAGDVYAADMVLIATGVRPVTGPARTAGITVGATEAVKVDRKMATSARDVFAAGDCAETWHRILRKAAYLPLGTTAHKQGRIAGENMVGGSRNFQGSLGTQAVRVFNLTAAGTGLRDRQAAGAGLDPLTAMLTVPDRNPYSSGAREIHMSITGDRRSGRLLGAQMVGHRDSEIAKRIDIVAEALHSGMKVEDLCDIDLSYTPPLSSPWDPVQKAAMHWVDVRK